MADIYADASDNWLLKSGSSWSAARDSNRASSIGTASAHLNSYGIRASRLTTGGRGSVSYTYYVTRSFLRFDTSGVTEVPTDGSIYIHGATFGNSDPIIVKSTASDTLIVIDFDNIDGWVSGADNNNNVRKYSDAYTSTWSTSGYNQFPLTGEALVDMVAYDNFKICIMDSVYDLSNSSPSSGFNYTGLYFRDEEDANNRDPFLQYSPPLENNSIFLGANF
tara:strand:+ start:250 stop:912 length:663 start_codon:yes stop_codon:yes gene_type:complete